MIVDVTRVDVNNVVVATVVEVLAEEGALNAMMNPGLFGPKNEAVPAGWTITTFPLASAPIAGWVTIGAPTSLDAIREPSLSRRSLIVPSIRGTYTTPELAVTPPRNARVGMS